MLCGDSSTSSSARSAAARMMQPGVLPREPRPAHPEEQRGRRTPTRGQHRARAHQVGIERRARVAADRHDALLVALAEQAHDLVGAVVADQVVDVERDGLGDPGAGRVEQLEQRLVAQRGRLVAVGRREQPLDLLDRERLRKALGCFGGATSTAGSTSSSPSSTRKRVKPRIDDSVRAIDAGANPRGVADRPCQPRERRFATPRPGSRRQRA